METLIKVLSNNEEVASLKLITGDGTLLTYSDFNSKKPGTLDMMKITSKTNTFTDLYDFWDVLQTLDVYQNISFELIRNDIVIKKINKAVNSLSYNIFLNGTEGEDVSESIEILFED